MHWGCAIIQNMFKNRSSSIQKGETPLFTKRFDKMIPFSFDLLPLSCFLMGLCSHKFKTPLRMNGIPVCLPPAPQHFVYCFAKLKRAHSVNYEIGVGGSGWCYKSVWSGIRWKFSQPGAIYSARFAWLCVAWLCVDPLCECLTWMWTGLLCACLLPLHHGTGRGNRVEIRPWVCT